MFLRKRPTSPYWIASWKDGRRSIERSTKTTNKHKAMKLLSRWSAEMEKSFYRDVSKITFGELSERWQKAQEPNVKLRTHISYEERIKRLLPCFKSKLVREIKPQDVEQFKTQAAKTVSARSVNYSLWVLRAILDYGVNLGYCQANAAKFVKGMKQTKAERKPFSLEELHRLFAVLEGQDKVLIQLAALCGLRLGECLALRWNHVDLEKETLEVGESYGGPKFGVDTPKNEGSRRTVLLPPVIVQALNSHRIQQEQYRRWHKNENYKDLGLVFSTSNGTYLDPTKVRSRILNPALKRAGLPHMRFHDLRGIAITLMLESGASLKHVMDQVGHKTPNMTLAVYSRVTKEAGRQAQNKLQTYVFG